MYKEAPTKELTEEEKIFAASGRSDMIATVAPEFVSFNLDQFDLTPKVCARAGFTETTDSEKPDHMPACCPAHPPALSRASRLLWVWAAWRRV